MKCRDKVQVWGEQREQRPKFGHSQSEKKKYSNGEIQGSFSSFHTKLRIHTAISYRDVPRSNQSMGPRLTQWGEGSRFFSLTSNDCQWMNVSCHGLARLNGYPHRFRYQQNAIKSFGLTETNPIIMFKVWMRSLPSHLCRSGNSISMRSRSVWASV